MFQPGKNTNIPSSSGAPMGFTAPDWTGRSIISFDGISLTIGMLILFVAAVWVWSTFVKKR